MITHSKTLVATPPGYTIREHLEIWGINREDFINQMGMSEQEMNRLFEGKMKLTFAIAARLQAVLGLSSNFWNNLERYYRDKKKRAQEENRRDCIKYLQRRRKLKQKYSPFKVYWYLERR